MDATKPYKFIGLGAMDATKPYSNYRLVTHFKFLIVGPDQKMVTKRP